MNEKKSFYITTTLPYVNADPHIGFAMEIIRADVIARWKKLEGFDVFFNTGTDEHGQKIWQKSIDAGKDVQDYVDGYAERFKVLNPSLLISPDVHFIRTTDAHHVKAAQEFWKKCDQAGDIYKKNYTVKYCVGCELEKTDSELVDGYCPLHPSLELEVREEENYFFRFSKYQKPLLDLYKKNPNFVVPDFRFNEIKAFVERGLEDFSISRLKEKMSWGVPVPGDDNHVMYVWFDALVNYISTLGWPEDEANFDKFWKNGTPVQYAGKDNLRQQSAMWQAMLLSVNLPTSHTIVIDGFINGAGGQKMSKSLGNTVDPFEVVEKYGAEALRYFVCRELSTFEDSDFTWERFHETYNANLANGIGNLTSRIMTMAEKNLTEPVSVPDKSIPQEFVDSLEKFELGKAINLIWDKIGLMDSRIQETEPFKLIKTDEEEAKKIIRELSVDLYTVARMLNPFMPQTSEQIKNLVKSNKKPEQPLFLRKDA
ncbi:MAG: methionyl-tRNA synthetase [Parcubacteria bacterium C7867-005]|nr:MAG: methionyl-tRNA synthetase [Parcubacteria bacterium C7867-005]